LHVPRSPVERPHIDGSTQGGRWTRHTIYPPFTETFGACAILPFVNDHRLPSAALSIRRESRRSCEEGGFVWPHPKVRPDVLNRPVWEQQALPSGEFQLREERGLVAIGNSFTEAVGDPAAVPDLMQALAKREREIDLPTIHLALRSLVGLAARKTGASPRSILAAELVEAPPDELWKGEPVWDPASAPVTRSLDECGPPSAVGHALAGWPQPCPDAPGGLSSPVG
jgi:hypothetical protein